MSRSIVIAQRSHILAAVLGQVASAKSAAQAESSVRGRITPLTRGRLNTLRYGAFVATLTLVLPYLGLYRQTSRNNLNALHAFVSDNRSRFRNADLNNAHTYGAYLTWREWDRENLKAITERANAKTRARREAANA